MVLIAPYSPDATTWLDGTWTNRYTGRAYGVTTEASAGYERPGLVTIKTYADVLTNYAGHSEDKSSAPDGTPCAPLTAGLLPRRPVNVAGIRHTGKESNRLDDLQAGLLQDAGELATTYDDFYTAVFVTTVIPRLRKLGVRETVRRTGISLGAVSDALSCTARPRPRHLAKYRALFEALERAPPTHNGQQA